MDPAAYESATHVYDCITHIFKTVVSWPSLPTDCHGFFFQDDNISDLYRALTGMRILYIAFVF
jgi:hypothetical protein